MSISSKKEDKFSIIKFDVDQILGYEGQEFQDLVLNSLEQNVNCIIVDLSAVKFISSWGIGMLIHGLATTRNRGSEFKIAGLADNVMQVFQKVKIDTVLSIYKNVDLAKS
ncbi:MAG TPA: STAS domain-containing protein [Ignavibacteriaceae bacterium]|nr:STAS domain-containing protein [Ignavibacteriaceae bacterium]